MEGIMFDARRRQLGWLFFLLLAGMAHGQGPATTVVSDVVFRAEAAKASDAVMVHKSGRESIAGLKQFSAPPSVATRVLATDTDNEGYVDGAVASSGSGSYVRKTGDSMRGPLLLSGEKTDIQRG